jgi:uncharacterized protein YabN with tetrapyrrole methylase and pyrophosphatase domain
MPEEQLQLPGFSKDGQFEGPGFSSIIVKPEEHHNSDLLASLVRDQTRFMELLGIPQKDEGAEYLNDPVFKAAVDGVVTESAEVLSAMSVLTKPWKQKSIEAIRADVLEESVDVLFMLLEVFILARVSPDELVKMYRTKLRKNLDRIARVSNHQNVEVDKWMKELDDALQQKESR